MATLIPIISLAITLISVIVGPLVALRVAKKQIYASVVSANRQQWISALRDLFAEYITTAYHIAAANALGEFEDDRLEKFNKLLLLENKIRLFLDLAEPANKKLIDLAERVRSKAFSLKPELAEGFVEEFKPLSDEFMLMSQLILKHERVLVEMESES